MAAGLALAGRPGVAPAQQADTVGPRVDTVVVEGNRRITNASILGTAQIPLHTPVGFRDIQRAIRALFGTSQFDDVQILREARPDSTERLVIVVKERPLLRRAIVRGVEKLSERSVRDRMELPAGRPLDPGMVVRAVQRIDSLYRAEGYYLAQVTPQIVQDDSDHVQVEFTVTEGRRIAIAAVRVEGNERVPAKQVVGAMQTRPEGFWWWQHGEYDSEKLREDLEQRLPQFYGSLGYVDFHVVHDTLLVNERNGKATLVVQVEEGKPYEVGSVSVQGNHAFSTDQVLSLNPFQTRSGGLRCLLKSCGGPAYFDQSKWDDATQKLRTQYSNTGYIYAQIEPRVDRVPPADSGGVPKVNLTWAIDEGRPAIINKIDIVGNDVTYERVIRDALVVIPGGVFAQDMIIRSYQNISNLGFFEQPLPFPDTRKVNQDDPNSDIDLIFKVKEKHTGNVNFGASVGQGTGLGGFLGLDEPNLFGQGKRGHVQWQFGSNINDFELSYTDPQLFESRVSGTASVHNTRLRYIIADLGTISTRGGSIQFGFPLPHDRYSRIFPSYAIEWERYSGASQNLATGFRCSECMRSTAGLSYMRDTRVDMPFPTGGTMHTASLALTGGILGGSATFQKLDLEGHWYAPAGQLGGVGPTGGGIRFVLGLTTKAGFVFGDAGPFFQQLYSMGGTQYGIPLRGYDEFSITPQGFNPNATSGAAVSRSAFGKSYFAGTAEFGARFSQAIYASAFYDVGNVWASAGAFNPTRLFRGAGVGVALITPLGPLGLDLAYGFDRVNAQGQPNPGWKLHFKIGNFFQ